ncbi:MAG: hypothetical protein J2P56_07630, partial [Verrucomicrobia bacterium]|nr:hypothetical protein [Verrucomicrobiota bacterium]
PDQQATDRSKRCALRVLAFRMRVSLEAYRVNAEMIVDFLNAVRKTLCAANHKRQYSLRKILAVRARPSVAI